MKIALVILTMFSGVSFARVTRVAPPTPDCDEDCQEWKEDQKIAGEKAKEADHKVLLQMVHEKTADVMASLQGGRDAMFCDVISPGHQIYRAREILKLLPPTVKIVSIAGLGAVPNAILCVAVAQREPRH